MASIEKRVTEQGRTRWVVRYRTPAGAQRSKTFDRKVDAERYVSQSEASKLTGEFIDPQRGRTTVGEVAASWLAGKANLAASSRDRAEGIVNTWITPTWGAIPVSAVTHGDVQAWLSGIDRAPGTVVKIHRVFSQIMKFAVRDGRIGTNPAADVALPRVRSRPMRFLTHQQVEEMAERCGPDWSLIVRFLAYTGLRWGELAALRVGAVDFLRRRISVRESVTPVKGKMVFSDTTKTGEDREVPLPRFLADDLAAQAAGKRRDELLFEGPRGGALRAQTFQRAALTRVAINMGLASPKLDERGRQVTNADGVPQWTEVFHPHELRHTAASLAIHAGANVKLVQTMLGHKSATLTLDRYGHLFPDSLDDLAAAMEASRTRALG